MAVQEQTPYIEYTANGASSIFALGFDCESKDHLIVTLDGVEPPVGNWSLTGGSVVFTTAPTNGVLIVIQRNTPLERTTDYQSYNNSFRPESVNKEFDGVWWKLQELWHQTTSIGSALKQEVQDRIEEDLSTRSWVTVLLNNIVDSGLVSALAITTVDSINELQLLNGWYGRSIHVKETSSLYKYDADDTTAISLSGWVLQHRGIISTKQLGITSGNITSLIQYAIANSFQIEVEEDVNVTTTVFNQNNVFGRGILHHDNNPVLSNDYSFLAPRSLNPYPRPMQNRTGWYDNVESRGNFENGAGYGLMVNRKDVRPQVAGFRTLAGMQAYTSTDIVGLYVDIAAQKHFTISNSTVYTATSITSPDIVAGINVKKGDFLRTGRDAAGNSNLQWRGWVTDIDFAANKIYTSWWVSENGTVGTPTNGIVCITPDTNSIWGHNTNVYIFNDDPATKIQGFELGVYADNGKIYEALNAFFAVNLNPNSKATNAFLTSGTWSNGLRTSADNAVYAEGTNGLRWTHAAGGAALYAQSGTLQGYLLRSDGGSTPRYTMGADGKQSHNRQEYRVITGSTTHNGLNPSVIFGANASAAHTTTLSTTSMTAGTVLKFKNLQAIDWSIVAGSTTYVLNTSGTIDSLELFYDGTNFLKLFAGKSL